MSAFVCIYKPTLFLLLSGDPDFPPGKGRPAAPAHVGALVQQYRRVPAPAPTPYGAGPLPGGGRAPGLRVYTPLKIFWSENRIITRQSLRTC